MAKVGLASDVVRVTPERAREKLAGAVSGRGAEPDCSEGRPAIQTPGTTPGT